jgi:hypothetical protein
LAATLVADRASWSRMFLASGQSAAQLDDVDGERFSALLKVASGNHGPCISTLDARTQSSIFIRQIDSLDSAIAKSSTIFNRRNRKICNAASFRISLVQVNGRRARADP